MRATTELANEEQLRRLQARLHDLETDGEAQDPEEEAFRQREIRGIRRYIRELDPLVSNGTLSLEDCQGKEGDFSRLPPQRAT